MSVLLDTHVWVWYVEGDEKRLSKKSVEFLKKVEQARELLVSDISFWEIANKSTRLPRRSDISRSRRAGSDNICPLAWENQPPIFSDALRMADGSQD